MKDKLLFWSVTVALAGFLFGFDTVVISGADQQLQDLWATSDLFHGFVVMSMALWGTVIGAIFGNIPTDRLGRKRTLFWIGMLYLGSAVGSAIAFKTSEIRSRTSSDAIICLLAATPLKDGLIANW